MKIYFIKIGLLFINNGSIYSLKLRLQKKCKNIEFPSYVM